MTTRWTLVLWAGEPNSPEAVEALETLCRAYWQPLYNYVRRRGYAPSDAQDLTQEFFAQLLAHNWMARADRRKGRFRSFLLMALSRFLANEWDKLRTLKRCGGSERWESLSLDAAETRYALEPVSMDTPERAFEKQWAMTILEEVLAKLRQDYVAEGKGALFQALKPCLLGVRESQPYATLANDLGMSEGAVKTAVCRLRERYRQRLKDEVAHTVASPAEVDSELRHLLRVVAGG